MSTKFATLQRKLPLVYEFALCFFSLLFAFGIGFYSLKSLRRVFSWKKIAPTLHIKVIPHCDEHLLTLSTSAALPRLALWACVVRLIWASCELLKTTSRNRTDTLRKREVKPTKRFVADFSSRRSQVGAKRKAAEPDKTLYEIGITDIVSAQDKVLIWLRIGWVEVVLRWARITDSFGEAAFTGWGFLWRQIQLILQ